MNTFLPHTVQGRKVCVMGLGRFGGGLGVTRYLLKHGAQVVLNDRASRDELVEPLAQLGEHPNLRIELGGHDPAILDGVDILVVNPAVPKPWEDAFISDARALGILITTEIEILYRQLDPSRVIAVTGSAGKSTTAAMTHHALYQLGISGTLGGNIGGSLLDQFDDIIQDKDSVVVLELSSAMLYWLWGQGSDHKPSPPGVGCVTSYAPNHLDWHGEEIHYRQSKQLLVQCLRSESTCVLTDALAEWISLTDAMTKVVAANDAIENCMVPGHHNAMNAACAFASIQAICPELHPPQIVSAIQSFAGLPHRLHLCFEHEGVAYYDDSKSTTPDATCLAIEALSSRVSPSKIHLIAGGYDKGSDLNPIVERTHLLKGLYCIGSTSRTLAKHSKSDDCGSLDIAMRLISERLDPDDVVLLSPGCASWDQFDNYEQRGRVFLELAKAHAGVNK